MTLRRNSPRAKRRWLALGTAVASLLVLVVGVTLAVHDLDFQLDGNVITSPDSNVGGTTQETDWEDLFGASGEELTLPTGFNASGFNRDFRVNPDCVLTGSGTFCTADQTTYATGSKDTLPITPGWQCNFDNNVNSKIDIMNSYAAAYDASGDEILYFAMERNTNTGTANVGFWFLQDENVGCSSAGGSAAFTGDHVDGDLLVVSEFTNGGVINTILVYEWEGGANGALNPDPIAGGSGAGVDCSTVTGLETVCGEVNTGTITTPWKTANKQDGVANSLRISEFFEAGLNLTDEGLGGRCFNTFIATTRSSTSLTATIFDFSRGSLGQCTSTTTTTPKKGDGTTNITSEPIPATGQLLVKDSAAITVTGADAFDATVTFYLCRESELTDADSNPATPTTCASGGTQIGAAKAVTTSPATVVSDAAGLTAAERYCWRAEFSGDTDVGVPSSSDSRASECFVVTPITPTLTTDASDGVTLSNPIYDTISLTGTADRPGTNGIGPGGTINATNRADATGTLSFTAYGPDDCTTVAHSGTIAVSGDNTAYGGAGSATQFVPTAIGQYTYVVSYGGDSPNTNAVPASACPDLTDTEEVTVTGVATLQTRQRWLPNDAAQITGPTGTTLSGNVVFTLYNDGTCGASGGTVHYTQTIAVSSGTGPANNKNVTTSNTTFHVTANNDGVAWSWKVSYVDANLGDPADECETTTPAFTLND
jgi:hypothetical protein